MTSLVTADSTLLTDPLPLEFSATWNGTPLSPVQTSTLSVQLTVDPCEPPTILSANQNQVAAFSYVLRGVAPSYYDVPALVYEPSHCTPVGY